MQKINTVFFDIGGVIIDHIASVRNTAVELGISADAAVELFKKYADGLDRGTFSWADFEPIFYDTFNPKKHLKHALVREFVDRFTIIQETYDFIHELEGEMGVGILSNVAEDVFSSIKERGLIPTIHYESQIISSSIGYIKPEKEIFDIASKSVLLTPSQLLLVDDKEINTQAAMSFGWSAVLFKTKYPRESIIEVKQVLALK